MSLLNNAGPYTLTKTWYVDGTATDVGTVTIGVVDANGDTVVATGTSTTNNADGTYTYSLADQTEPNLLTVTWTRSDGNGDLVDHIEVVGSRLFTEAAFRAFNDDQFASTSRYTDADIAAARDAVTEQLERWTGVGWAQRYARVELAGTGDNVLYLSDGWCRTSAGIPLNRPGRLQNINSLISATVGSTSQTVSTITVHGSHLVKTSTWTSASTNDPLNVTVEYTYGHPYQVDSVDRIAMLLAADRLRETALSSRATTWSDELGTYRFETPGRAGNVSTIPEVNEWVKAHRSPLLSV